MLLVKSYFASLGAVSLACVLASCASVHDATPNACPADQRSSDGQCVCISTQAPPVDGSCSPVEPKCSVSDCVDDENPCTEPTCLSGADTCTNEPVTDETACEDDSLIGVCMQGSCVPPQWELGKAFQIAEADEEVSTPLVAVAADGNAIALWSQGDQVRGCAFDPMLGWGTPVVVEPAHVAERGIALGMDAAGNAIALYARVQQGAIEVVAERYTAETGLWDSFAVLSSPGAVTDDPQLAVTPSGEVVATWWQGPDDIAMARGRSDTMTWAPAVLVSPDDGLEKYEPFVSLTGSGEGGLVYRAAAPGGAEVSGSVWVAAVRTDSVAPPVQVSDSADWTRSARIAAGMDADLMVVWEEVDNLLYARFESDAWLPAGPLEEASASVASPEISIDGDGNYQVAWLQAEDVRTRRFVASESTWDDTQILLVSGSNGARAPNVAAPPNGEARVTWAQDQHVRLTRFVEGSGWAPFVKLSPELEPPALGVKGPQVAVGADGTEVVVWADGLEIWSWANRPD